MVLNPDQTFDVICEMESFPLAMDEKRELDDLCLTKTAKVMGKPF